MSYVFSLCEVLRELIRRGADLEARNKRGEMAWLFVLSQPECARALLAAGADVDTTAGDGWTAAMNAAGGGHVEVLGELIRRGADLEVRNKDGETALYLTTLNRQPDCARALLAAGARPDS